MVALRLHQYKDEIPQIARIVKITDFEITVEWWVGTFHGIWIEWKEKGKVINETFPRNAVLSTNISFYKSRRLTPNCITELKELYLWKELVQIEFFSYQFYNNTNFDDRT